MNEITVKPEDIAKIFKDDLSDYVKKKILEYKPVYSPLSKEEEEEAIIKIISTLLDPFLVYSGPHRLKQWEKGWGENLGELSKKKTADAVLPRYFGKYKINRLNQSFIKAVSPNFERDMFYIAIDYIFDKYLRKAENIYDFGCGTGQVLLKAREVNPTANLFGLDWAKASQKIIKKMSDVGLVKNITGYNFDIFNPDKKIKIAGNSLVYTLGSLEQVGSDYKKFVSYLLKNKPVFCINIEPMAEFLDETKLIDYLAIKYFRKRNYLDDYLDYLKKLEKEGKIKIHETKRTTIGSLYAECYSYVVWSPL